MRLAEGDSNPSGEIKTQFHLEEEIGLPNPLAALQQRWPSTMQERIRRPRFHTSSPSPFTRFRILWSIDETTKRNLELTQSLFGQGKKGSLFWVLDETMTAMGSRKLREWLNYPLLDVQEIERRLEGVSELKEKRIERKDLRDL